MPSSWEQSRPLRVLCVDDNPLVCDALRVVLHAVGDIDYAGCLNSADQLVHAAAETDADIVVLDLDMPGADPIRELRRLGEARPHTRTIVFTGHIHPDLINNVFDAGAWGYVGKEEGIAAIIAAIRRVGKGEVAIGGDAALARPGE